MKIFQNIYLPRLFLFIISLSISLFIFSSAAFAEPSVVVKVTIEEVQGPNCDCECCVDCECDFYPKVIIDGQEFGDGDMNKSNENHIFPNWTFLSKAIPISRGSIPVKIQIWDSDSPTGDDLIKITPEPYDESDNTYLDLSVKLAPCSVTGEFYVGNTYGGTAACNTPLVSSGRTGTGKDEWATIKFRVELEDPAAAALGRILFVPFCWLGDSYKFKGKVNAQLDVFYKALDLDSCKDSFSHEILDPSKVNARCPTINSPSDPVCQNAMKYVMESLDAAGINKGDFNEIVAFTDHDICGNISGGYAGRGSFWAETKDLTTFPHEFGHLYDLSDEYTSAKVGGCYNNNLSINFLDLALGCDPLGDCCGECKNNCQPCCAGNKNPDGGRCFMATDSSPYGYCVHCYNQITNPPNKRTAGFPNGALALKCGETNPIGPQSIGELHFGLTEDGKLNEFSIETYQGRPSFGNSHSEGRFRIEMMKQGSLIFATDFERPSPYCEGDGCIQEGHPFFVHWKAIIPPGITESDVLTVYFSKDGLFTSQSTVNGNPPVADAGLDQIAECTGSGQATVTLDASGSSDPDGDTLQYAWSAPGITFSDPAGETTTAVFPLGTTTVTLVVRDGIYSSEPVNITVTVVDSTPPFLSCPAEKVVQCKGPTDPSNTGTAIASDACDATLHLTFQDHEVIGDCPQNRIINRTWSALDDSRNVSSCTQTIRVVDTTPPEIKGLSARPNTLWPPNHQMIPVEISVSAQDTCDPSPVCSITSITSNEPANGLGDGDTAPDWDLSGNLGLKLRSERSGTGKGRVYTINVQCTDCSGNASNKSVVVTVPKSQAKQ
jgi:hypothetical protein